MQRRSRGRGRLIFSRNTWAEAGLAALLLIVAVAAPAALGQTTGDAEAKTVIGPRNPDLHDGAQALLNGDVDKGVELTLRGLEVAHGRRERQAALSNLCAGYLLLERFDDGLGYCDRALAENARNWRALNNRALIYMNLRRFDEAEADLDLAQEIAPHARTLKEARGMLRDEVEPVTPNIVIDDRRDTSEDDDD